MAGIVSYEPGDSFILRTYKHSLTYPQYSWSNTYEFYANTAGDQAHLQQVGLNIMNFEATFHLANVSFDRGVFGTWGEDSHPYDPTTFFDFKPDLAVGQRAVSTAMPLTIALYVRRIVTTGRMGKVFYRGVFNDADVVKNAGGFVYTPTALDAVGIAYIAGAEDYSINDLLSGTDGLQLAMIGTPKGTNILTMRNVYQIPRHGAAEVQIEHGYFDRAEPVA